MKQPDNSNSSRLLEGEVPRGTRMHTDVQRRTVTLSDEEMVPHLKHYLRKIVARKWIAISIFLICVASTTLYVFLQSPIYRAKSRLEIQPATTDSKDIKAAYDPTLSGVAGSAVRRAFLETQYQLILSDSVIEKTARHFDLQRPIRSGFEVLPVQHTWLVDVTFEWTDPVQAAEIVNYLVDVYLDEYGHRTRSVDSEMLEAKENLAADLKLEVSEKYKAWQDYISGNNLVRLENAPEKMSQYYNNLRTALNDAILNNSEAKRRYDEIQAAHGNGTLEEMPEIFEDATFNALTVQLVSAQLDLKRLQQDFGRIHPSVESAEKEIDMIERMIAREKEAFIAYETQRYERARKAEEFQRKLLDDEEKKLEQFYTTLGEYNNLENEYKQVQQKLSDVNKVVRELEMALAIGNQKGKNIHIINKAKVPVAPVEPNKTQTITLAAIIGLIIGVGLCLVADYLDTTIKTKNDVERILGIPTLGYVPPIMSEKPKGSSNAAVKPELWAWNNPRSILAESFRSIRTSLMFSKAGEGLKSVLVTSAVPLEGKTTVSLNVAIALAQTGKKVLLIDSDLRRPRVCKVFETPSKPGLSNILAGEGETSLDRAIRQVEVENLSILLSGPNPPNPAELLGSDEMKALAAEVAERFDHVIYDTPPILNATDGTIVAQYADGVVLVVRSFKTEEDCAMRALDMLDGARVNILGAVLNNADMSKNGYEAYGGKYYQTYYDSENGQSDDSV